MPRSISGNSFEGNDAAGSRVGFVMNGSVISGVLNTKTSRIGIIFTNNGTNPIWLGLGVNAAANSGVMLPPNQPLTLTGYTGAITLLGTNPDRVTWSEF